MKRLILLILFFQAFLLTAQNFEDSWTGYFSYVSVKSISKGNDKIYAATENAVFTYDLSTEELATISTVNGLSGKLISTIYYSDAFGLLIIGYENGLIEIVTDGEDNILSVVDILEKPSIPPNKKRINHLYEYNNNLYIATQYGISVYNLSSLEFGDSYFIGDSGTQINVSQTTVFNEIIYAATSENGIKSANVNNDNLIDYEQWTSIASGGYRGIQSLNSEIYVARNDNKVFEYTPGTGLSQVDSFNASIKDFEVSENILTITTKHTISAFSEGYELLSEVNSLPDYDYELQSGLTFNNSIYMGTTEEGMLKVPFATTQAQQILPDGPLLNQPFKLDASPGQLWVVFGEVDLTFNPYPLDKRGISNYRNETWKNIKYDSLIETLGVNDVNDLVYVKINQKNTAEVFMSSFQKGLLKMNGQNPSILFNETNSPLDIPNGNEGIGIRIYGSTFDREENLWFLQSRTNDGLIKRNTEGQFQLIDISSIIQAENELALSEIAISREGYVFFGAVQTGLIGYNPTTGEFKKVGEEAGHGNLPSTDIKSLTFNNQNQLWIGTRKGLRVLYGVGSFFDPGNNPETSAIIIDDQSVGAGQELLFLQSISDIEIDGSNNVWISTSTSGVFYFSSNGQETLLRFTADNSPLPSDNVLDIAIDHSTGLVYFATVNGLVAFKGTSTAPKDDLESVYAFPNPVRPNFFGNVTIDGLTKRANVKITDITGNLVFETTSEGGSIQWDTTAFGRHKVASGVYLVLITSDDNLETKVIKIMIIR